MNRTNKQLIASALFVLMLFSFSACAQTTQTEPVFAPSDTSEVTAVPQNGENGCYRSAFVQADNEPKSYMEVLCFGEDGFYTLIPSREGGLEDRVLAYCSTDGSCTALPGYVPLSSAEESDDRYTTCSLCRMARSENGQLALVYLVYENWNDAPEDVDPYSSEYYSYEHFEETWFLRLLDADGSERLCVEFEPSFSDWFWPNGLLYLGDRILMSCNSALCIWSDGGEMQSVLSAPGYINALITTRDGTPALVLRDSVNYDNDNRLAFVDTTTGRVTRTAQCPDDAFGFCSGGGVYDLFFTRGNGTMLYGFDISAQKETIVFDWIDVDVIDDDICGYRACGDGSFLCVTNLWNYDDDSVTTELVSIEKLSDAGIPSGQELTLACLCRDSLLERTVAGFNREGGARIRILDYSSFITETDPDAGFEALRVSLGTENSPDLLYMRDLPYRRLAATGLLEDLYPFLLSDETLSPDDFLENVLRALETGGKLCATAASFNIVTLAGRSDLVGTSSGWSLDDLKAALASAPDGCTVLDPFTTSGDMLRDIVSCDLDSYVNWEDFSCGFSTGSFSELLSFSGMLPRSFEEESYDWSEYRSENESIRNGKQLLMTVWIASFDDYLSYDASLGGQMSCVGYPGVAGSGARLFVEPSFAMSSSCHDKAAAWSFLRQTMDPEGTAAQYIRGFPVEKEAFQSALREAMEVRYMTDENGEPVLDENNERVPMIRASYLSDDSEETIVYYCLSEEQAADATRLLYDACAMNDADTLIRDLILKVADDYLSGRSSAEETAKAIDRRVSLCLSELY